MGAEVVRYLREFIRHPVAKWAKVPDSVAGVWPNIGIVDKAQAQKLLTLLVDVAVDRRAGVDLDLRNRNHVKYVWDRARIEEYKVHRIRSSGCRNLLRSSKMKQKYPHINNQGRV